MGGPLEGIQCLSADAFVYFLPGLMKLVLDDPSTRDCIVDGIVTRFTRPDYLFESRWFQSKAQGHKRKREQKKLDRERERHIQDRRADEELTFALLSSRQRQFLAQFLREALQQEPMTCPVPVNSAIHNLEQGKIDEYRQKDVWQWLLESPSIAADVRSIIVKFLHTNNIDTSYIAHSAGVKHS